MYFRLDPDTTHIGCRSVLIVLLSFLFWFSCYGRSVEEYDGVGYDFKFLTLSGEVLVDLS